MGKGKICESIVQDRIDLNSESRKSLTILYRFLGRVCRYEFRTGHDTLSQTLHTTLTSIQMGLAEDKKGWTVAID